MIKVRVDLPNGERFRAVYVSPAVGWRITRRVPSNGNKPTAVPLTNEETTLISQAVFPLVRACTRLTDGVPIAEPTGGNGGQ